MITVDKWDYNGWRRRMAFQLSRWHWDGVRKTVHPEQIILTATQPHLHRTTQNKSGLQEGKHRNNEKHD